MPIYKSQPLLPLSSTCRGQRLHSFGPYHSHSRIYQSFRFSASGGSEMTLLVCPSIRVSCSNLTSQYNAIPQYKETPGYACYYPSRQERSYSKTQAQRTTKIAQQLLQNILLPNSNVRKSNNSNPRQVFASMQSREDLTISFHAAVGGRC